MRLRGPALPLAALLVLAASTIMIQGCHSGGDPAVAEEGQGVEQARPAMIIAHRGLNKFAPENTLPAIEMAIEMGLDYVELDVRTTRDGRMVLMHGESVDATTDGSGLVKQLSAEEIRKLDAGSWFSPDFAGTQVPFFEEALDVMRGRIGAYIDVKDALAADLNRALRDTGMLESSVIYADPITHVVLRSLDSGTLVMPEVGDQALFFEFMRVLLHPAVVAASWGDPTKRFVDKIHSYGVKIFMDVLGEKDSPEGMQAALDLGVDAIQTDNPDILLEVMRNQSNN
jgi:glycerophosphoryl diester phosphodiesterase